jgi:hypothetical protein
VQLATFLWQGQRGSISFAASTSLFPILVPDGVSLVANYGNVQQITPLDRYGGGGVSELRGLPTGLLHEFNVVCWATTTGAQINPVINFVMLECLNQ